MYNNILLIDDNAVDNFINSTFIKNCELSRTINIFQSPLAALAFLKSGEKNLEKRPGLIFLDINMPELDGFAFLKEFSTLPDPIKQAFKVILLTSSFDPLDASYAKENPLVSKFIAKPLTSNFLLSLKA
jgi:CheY-like chemotaxis protein